MSPVQLNNMLSLLTDMLLAASKAAVHHGSKSSACACDNSCLVTVARLHAFCLNTDHALDICLKSFLWNDSHV